MEFDAVRTAKDAGKVRRKGRREKGEGRRGIGVSKLIFSVGLSPRYIQVLEVQPLE
jgi:hypothetical protein